MDKGVAGPCLGEHVGHEMKNESDCCTKCDQAANLGTENGTRDRDGKNDQRAVGDRASMDEETRYGDRQVYIRKVVGEPSGGNGKDETKCDLQNWYDPSPESIRYIIRATLDGGNPGPAKLPEGAPDPSRDMVGATIGDPRVGPAQSRDTRPELHSYRWGTSRDAAVIASVAYSA